MAPLGVLIENLCAMASSNEISGPSLAELVRLAGGQGSFGDAEPILEPAKLSLSELSASALRKAFQQALVRKQEFSSEELELVEQFVLSVSNIEQLLSTYFTLFPIGHGPDRKTYLYLAWILWAFLWLKSVGRTAPEPSIYTQLPRIGADVITFNYTNFFVGGGKRACFFHGQLDRYLRLDDRKLVADDSRLRGIPSVEHLADFLEGLRLDVTKDLELDIPAIVPPISFKPAMSRDQLRMWAKADDLIQASEQMIIVGYSFARADEHFNGLLRQTKETTRVILVNPDLSTALPRASAILNVAPESLVTRQQDGYEVRASRRLTAIQGKAEELDADLLIAALR